jgi:hypothetical protein
MAGNHPVQQICDPRIPAAQYFYDLPERKIPRLDRPLEPELEKICQELLTDPYTVTWSSHLDNDSGNRNKKRRVPRYWALVESN